MGKGGERGVAEGGADVFCSRMNRTDRLVAMVMHLQGRRLVRAGELAERFSISLRTVYRDIAALGEAGVPIIGEAGVGYSLVRGYNLPPIMLTADEAAALVVGAQMVRHFGDASLVEPMASAIDKLRAVLPRERQEQVDRLGRQTIISSRPGRIHTESRPHPWLLSVQRGVAQRQVLRMAYRAAAAAEETIRDVEPLGVVFYGGAWYLVGWCRLRKDIRHFRVDRVQRLEVLPESFPVRAGFSLSQHLLEQTEGRDTQPARIWLAERVVERGRAESWATLIEDRRCKGGREFTLFTYSLDWLARWLLGFGENAEAREPPELRERLLAQAEVVASRYRGTDAASVRSD